MSILYVYICNFFIKGICFSVNTLHSLYFTHSAPTCIYMQTHTLANKCGIND